MKKSAIAVACTGALALALFVPFGFSSNAPSPGAAVIGSATSQVSSGAIAPDGQEDAAVTGSADATSAMGDEPFGGAEYVPGEALVEFAEGVDSQAGLEQLAADTGLEGLSIAEQNPDYVKLSIPESYALDDAVNRISASSAIDAVQPNYVYHIVDDGTSASLTPRASLDLEAGTIQLSTQAAISEMASDGDRDKLWHLDAINAEEAWDVVKNKNYVDGNDPTAVSDKNRVTVAIFDNCFNVNHPDLKNNVIKVGFSPTDVSAKNIGDKTNVKTPDHGTHVAGIIAAQANNRNGTANTAAGVSYNAKILPIRVCDSGGSITTDYLMKAYTYVINNKGTYNIRVINLSIGEGRTTSDWHSSDWELFSKIDEAHQKGIVTVTAACNADGESGSASEKAPFYAFPTDYPTCVSVINVDKNGKRSSSSNYNKNGQTVKDISAPGEKIYSTTLSDYGTSSGTSMAAPSVAGTLALMFAKYPGMTADDAVDRLYSTATDLDPSHPGFDAEYGFGRVDAQAAVASSTRITGSRSVVKGKTATLKVVGGGSGWKWKSRDEKIVKVNDGVVTGVSCGSAEIIATNGTTELRRMMSVYDPTIVSDTAGFTITNGFASLAYHESAQLAVADKQPAVWNWTSSDPTSVSVGGNTGVIKVEKLTTDKVKITATLESDSSVQASILVNTTARDISDATIWLSPTSYVYSGSPNEPEVTSVMVGGEKLTPGVDYEVSGYSRNTYAGEGRVTLTGKGNYTGEAIATFAIYSSAEEQEQGSGSGSGPEPKAGDMYRLYNPWSGEHFYTADDSERDGLIGEGWDYEGVGWTAPESGDPVYRLYNAYAGDHHYTLSADERDELVYAGWDYEGLGWYSDVNRTVPLYREYNPFMDACNHNYTTDYEEHMGLVALGWHDEEIGWYGV